MREATDPLKVLTERMADLQHRARERGRTARHARMRAGLRGRLEEPQPRLSAGWWGALGAMGAAAVAVLLWVMLSPRVLTVTAEPSSGDPSQAYFIASDDEALRLSFSDGTAVELEPRARVRVAALRADGAELVLESGTLEARVEPGSSDAWAVMAGPFRVELVGAGLTMHWEHEHLELYLHTGRATVQGPGIDGLRELVVSERLTLGTSAPVGSPKAGVPASAEPEPEPAEREKEHDDRADEPVGADEPEAGVSSPSRARHPRRGRTPRAGTDHGGNEPDGWRSLARQGRYRQAIEAAEAAGFSRLCDALGAAALLELADAGRYARKIARAREALRALRRRFPGTKAAAAAAFDLGRLGSGCTGVTWFRTYLRERPQGSMAEAARRRVDECAGGSAREAGPPP